mgnify:CR=1 FL=1
MDTSALKSTLKKLAERYGQYRRSCREGDHAKCFDDHQQSEAAFDTKDRGTGMVWPARRGRRRRRPCLPNCR